MSDNAVVDEGQKKYKQKDRTYSFGFEFNKDHLLYTSRELWGYKGPATRKIQYKNIILGSEGEVEKSMVGFAAVFILMVISIVLFMLIIDDYNLSFEMGFTIYILAMSPVIYFLLKIIRGEYYYFPVSGENEILICKNAAGEQIAQEIRGHSREVLKQRFLPFDPTVTLTEEMVKYKWLLNIEAISKQEYEDYRKLIYEKAEGKTEQEEDAQTGAAGTLH